MTRPTEPVALIRTMLEFLEAGRPFAVATVLETDRSTPVKAGAKAVIEAKGTIHGTVGGGAVEAEAQRQARRVVRSGRPVMFDFDLGGPGVHEPGPICGGRMRLLLVPSSVARRSHYRRAAAALARRERGIWLTTLRHGSELAVTARFIAQSEISDKHGLAGAETLAASLDAETPSLLVQPAAAGTERVEVFIEPQIPRPVLLIIGGGHVGQAVAAQADLLGFEIVVIEDRPDFADPTLFPPGVKTRCGGVAEEVTAFPMNQDTFVVLVSRGHQQDALALRACIRRPAAYIGMIGSRRKVPLIRRQFLKNAWATREQLDRVYAPIGLDIGAVTVPEIAASIMAQIISVRRKCAAPRMPRR